MNTPTRVAGFLLGVATLFGGSFAVGNVVGPVAAEPESQAEDGHGDGGHVEMATSELPPGV